MCCRYWTEESPELREITDLWMSMTPKQHEVANEILKSVKKL